MSLDMEIGVLGRLDEVIATYRHLRQLEEHPNPVDPIGHAELVRAAQQALSASGSMLEKQLQASLLALDQQIRKPGQVIRVRIF